MPLSKNADALGNRLELDGRLAEGTAAEVILKAITISEARDTTGRIDIAGLATRFKEWTTKVGTISVTTSGQGQGTVAFLSAFPAALVLALCMATDAQVVRDTVPDSVAQFGFRRIDGANLATVIHFIAVGY